MILEYEHLEMNQRIIPLASCVVLPLLYVVLIKKLPKCFPWKSLRQSLQNGLLLLVL
jgi:hypothetical protein